MPSECPLFASTTPVALPVAPIRASHSRKRASRINARFLGKPAGTYLARGANRSVNPVFHRKPLPTAPINRELSPLSLSRCGGSGQPCCQRRSGSERDGCSAGPDRSLAPLSNNGSWRGARTAEDGLNRSVRASSAARRRCSEGPLVPDEVWRWVQACVDVSGRA
jgi:hypothetical protein